MFNNILNFDKYFEKNLSLPELGKVRPGIPQRGNVLINKILNKGELKVGDKTVTVDKLAQFVETPKGQSASWTDPNVGISQITKSDGSYDPVKAEKFFKYKNKYRITFKDKKDFEFRLDQIVKTKDFGSSGAGKDTRKFESIQAVFVAIKVDNPLLVLKGGEKGNIERCYDKFLDDGGLEDVKLDPSMNIDYDLLESYLDDKNWVSTFCEIPNKLWIKKDGIKKYIDPNLKYVTYHTGYKGSDSPYINLQKKYKELSKKDGFSDIDYSKWCPADIYLIAKSRPEDPDVDLIKEFNNGIENITDIYDLATHVEKYFIPKLFIPISLKKISIHNKFKIITNSGRDVNLPDFEITKFRINSDFFGIGSKIYADSEWKYKDRVFDESQVVINFDSSNTSKNVNIDGEVEGSTSRHGKISFPWICKIIGLVIDENKESLPGLNKIIIQTQAELRKIDETLIQNQIEDISNKIKSLSSSKSISLDVRKAAGRSVDVRKNKNAAISRLQSLEVVHAIMSVYAIDKQLGDLVMTKIMRYALSIETEFFQSPMYLRVI
jgi:hypothetical protein